MLAIALLAAVISLPGSAEIRKLAEDAKTLPSASWPWAEYSDSLFSLRSLLAHSGCPLLAQSGHGFPLQSTAACPELMRTVGLTWIKFKTAAH